MTKFRDYAFDWIAWLLFAAIPAVIFWQSATSLAEQGAASGGPMQNAALYPRILATAMTVLVMLQAVRLALGRVRQASPLQGTETTRLALLISGVFVLYLVALPYAGFHITTPPFCFAMFLLLGLRVPAALFGAVVLWVATAYVFEGLLNVILPVGVFEIALFN